MEMNELPARLDDLIDFTRSQVTGDDPLEHLTSAVEVSGHLGDLADHLVGHFVDQARRAGASWTAIGQAMGVSKQAAQQRFVPKIGPRRGGGDDSYERFTDRARRVVDHARDEARETRHDAVGSLHLLLGLLAESEGIAAASIEGQGVSLEQVRGAARSALGTGDGDPGDDVQLAPDAAKALELALREALRFRHNYIGTEHILLGVLRDEKSAAAAVLTSLGLGRESTERWILAALKGYSWGKAAR